MELEPLSCAPSASDCIPARQRLGYTGFEQRSEYTAIGDTVNIASRLQNNAAGGQILVSEATARAAGKIFPMTKR